MDMFPVTLIFGLFGLIIGSFLNVVILRLEQGVTFGGRSMCPKCQALIRWYDNIPLVSFFVLRGRCRQCQTPISWQYPLVEFATGALFALFGTLSIGLATPPELVQTFWHLFLVSLLIAITVTDVRNMEIPLILLLAGVGGAVFAAVAETTVSGIGFLEPGAPWRMMLFGGGVAALLFYGLVYYSKETWMGMGDVWLAGIAGAAVGLPALLLLFTLSFFTGAVVGGALLLFGKKGMKSQIPFAPFLSVGTLSTLLLLALKPWWLMLLLLPIV
ncbi:MAG: A24 family peptidase [Undibacterium sp.]